MSAGAATLLVAGSMIGTGIFTTTGLLVRDLGSGLAVLLAWVVGGVVALAGSLCYAELSAAIPRDGGDYALLTRIYPRPIGFSFGIASFVVGFAAPLAAAALGFGHYVRAALGVGDPATLGIVLVLGLSAVHAFDVRRTNVVQVAATSLVLALAAVLVAAGLGRIDVGHLLVSERPLWQATWSAPFAVGLVSVYYAYSGWNAAAFVAGEVEEPGRSLPRALLVGTGLVTGLYLVLNVVFLASAPANELWGVTEVAHVAASHLFGAAGATAISLVIAAALVSLASAMIVAGPRVVTAMGEDYKLGRLAERAAGGGPAVAVALQAALSIGMLLTSSFDALITWVGLTLTISDALAVAGLVVLRYREPQLLRPFRTPGYPLVPALFLAVTAWTTVVVVREEPRVALASAATVALGLAAWPFVRRRA